MMQQFEVFHRRNRITFTGEHLAHVSSWRPHSPRWADLDLYSTQTADVWVFSRVGRSAVYHVGELTGSPALTCPRRLPFGHQLNESPDLSILEPCTVCCPELPSPDPDFLTTHVFEIPRPYAVVCDSAAMVDRQLRSSDGSMGWLSARLAHEAALTDPALSVIDVETEVTA